MITFSKLAQGEIKNSSFNNQISSSTEASVLLIKTKTSLKIDGVNFFNNDDTADLGTTVLVSDQSELLV